MVCDTTRNPHEEEFADHHPSVLQIRKCYTHHIRAIRMPCLDVESDVISKLVASRESCVEGRAKASEPRSHPASISSTGLILDVDETATSRFVARLLHRTCCKRCKCCESVAQDSSHLEHARQVRTNILVSHMKLRQFNSNKAGSKLLLHYDARFLCRIHRAASSANLQNRLPIFHEPTNDPREMERNLT
ncbi:hypothetical protein K505DRAFT_101545 [Melanomma pulvis-pyrius CBS 109.77]|uniref:Uncharacterized protein n=1 Tax=Melanomma pulvis-pyrius CBS 109.77 TaxID=1314802 RepID=A0A6A6WY50_9PLEO|nr:hypothetical protein K505DRAFT_101545 [Melanomma pulvis-pyrius CBS 109.77]